MLHAIGVSVDNCILIFFVENNGTHPSTYLHARLYMGSPIMSSFSKSQAPCRPALHQKRVNVAALRSRAVLVTETSEFEAGGGGRAWFKGWSVSLDFNLLV